MRCTFTSREELARLEERAASADELVLLDPEDHARRARWERVLAWYGASRSNAASAPGPSPEGHVVVAVGDEVALVARLFAGRERRPLLVVPRAEDVTPAVRAAGALSALVVADRRTTSVRALGAWRALSVPWGVITGVDLPGVAFALAKTALCHPAEALTWGFVDAHAGRRGVGRAHDAIDAQAATVQDVLSSDLDVLALVAHGEGAHANLESVVLCGRVGERERIDGRGSIWGCADTGAEERCKRVPGARKPTLTFSRLAVKTLVLASCSGYATAGELYPSDASAVLSALEGYTTAILTADRSVRLYRWLVDLTLGLLRAHGDASLVCRALDEVTLRDQHERAWVLVGDPSRRIAPPSPVPAIVEQSMPAALVVRGGELCVRAGESVYVRPGDVAAADATADWELLVDHLRSWRRASRSAARMELTLLTRYATKAAERDAVVALASQRWTIDAALHLATAAAATARRRGVWSDAIDEAIGDVAALASSYDEALAGVLAQQVFGQGFAEALEDGRAEARVPSIGLCPRCGLALATSRAVDPVVDDGARVIARCAICGPRESWEEGATRVDVVAPSALRAGEPARIEVTPRPATDPRDEPLGAAWMVIDLKDKGRGEVFFHARRSIDHEGAVFEIDVPRSLTPDLHTLECALVHRMRVAHLRTRLVG